MAQEESAIAAPPSGTTSTIDPLEIRPYASFWSRLLAALIDGALLSIVAYVITWLIESLPLEFAHSPYVVGMFGGGNFVYGGASPTVVMICQWLYEALFLSSTWQATIGRRVVHIKVAGMQGGRISFARATGRFFAKYLSALPLLAGYWIQLFTRHQQTLHDILSSCVVVDEGSGSLGRIASISIDSQR